MSVLPFPRARQWIAGQYEPQEPGWNLGTIPVDNDLRAGLGLMRARARYLAQNSDHARGFLRIVRNNVVGAPGFVFQSQAITAAGRPDARLRARIEAEWKAWGRRGQCEVSGKFSWRTLQRHVIETVARDGEAFLRIVRDWPNRWRFALQVIDPEQVDSTHTGEYQGREIRLGVEVDAWQRPVAYWLRAAPRMPASSYRVGDRERVPAAEMLHIYLPELVHQTRGAPWLAVAMARLHQMRGIEDAELQASRASAAKFAAYEANPEFVTAPETLTDSRTQSAILGADGQPLSTDPGQFTQDVAPGSMEVVPWGYQLKMLDPQHPNAAVGDLLKWSARSVSTGMGVSYNTLGNDAEGVNYTSLRFFLGVEHDHWTETQDWFEADLPAPAFEAWLLHQIHATDTLPIRPDAPHAAIERALAHKWQARRWDGPDPAKQAQADRSELENGTTTHTAILARKGLDLDDFLAQRVGELERMRAAAERAGVSLEQFLPYLSEAVVTRPSAPPTEDDAHVADPD